MLYLHKCSAHLVSVRQRIGLGSHLLKLQKISSYSSAFPIVDTTLLFFFFLITRHPPSSPLSPSPPLFQSNPAKNPPGARPAPSPALDAREVHARAPAFPRRGPRLHQRPLDVAQGLHRLGIRVTDADD